MKKFETRNYMQDFKKVCKHPYLPVRTKHHQAQFGMGKNHLAKGLFFTYRRI